MKHYFSTLSVLALSAMGLLAPTAKADRLNKETNITINQAIEVEGTVLPAGSYVLRLANLDRRVVQIFNARENHLIATVFAVPAERLDPPDSSVFRFYESESGQPPALYRWFYPGDPTGFEFRDVHRAPAIAAVQSNPATPSASGN